MPPNLTDEQQALKTRAMDRFHAADETHKRYRDRWDELDGLYNNTTDWRDALRGATRRDRIAVLRDGMKEFGAELFIPFSFTVVETVLPRMLSNRPKMLVLPRTKASEPNVEPMRLLIDAQQQQCDYEMKLQTTCKTSLIYGLGVQKVGWRTEKRTVEVMQQRPVEGPGLGPLRTRTLQWVPVPVEQTIWDDPDVADVSPYDFLWDPYADCIENASYLIHRSWRSTRYVLDKIASGQWALLPDLTAEDIEAHSSKNHYGEIWSNRRNIQGSTATFKGEIHEILEVHDGNEITIVLDREWPVAHFDSTHPMQGRKPFHISRPTEIPHQFAGKGEIEPIRDLQYEMNALRTDRRWNALLVLHKAFWYEDGAIDPNLVKIAPGALNPVNGPPNDVLKEIVPGDIPFSSYREEEAMKGDIDRTTGISDPAQGVGDAGQTATGVQLIQAAAGVRIQNKTRRMEVELIKPAAADFVALNQQRIREQREIMQQLPPNPGDPGPRHQWFRVGPAELAGEFSVQPEGGSTAPDNIPQMRQDAQIFFQLAANPAVDQRKMMMLALRNLGIDQPEAYLSPMQSLPPQTLDFIKAALVDQYGILEDEAAQELLTEATQQAIAQAEEEARAPGAPMPPGAVPPDQMAA